MNKKRMFIFGLCMGVLLTITFGLVVAIIDSEKSYTVYGTDDNTVTLKSEDGTYIFIDLEDTYTNSAFEAGSHWVINYR